MKKATILILLGILTLATALRLANPRNFNYYPDSYLYLIQAENIQKLNPFTPAFGEFGVVDKVDRWSLLKVGYPFLISIFSFFYSNKETVAYLLSFVFSLGSIILIFLIARNIFNSYIAGLFSAFLLSISFTHTSWSVTLMSEPMAAFLILTSLYNINTGKKTDTTSLISGIFFTFSVFTRPEYLVLLFPLLFYNLTEKENHQLKKTLCFLLPTFSIPLLWLYYSTKTDGLSSLADYININKLQIGIYLLFTILSLTLLKFTHKKWINFTTSFLQRIVPIFLIIATVLITANTMYFSINPNITDVLGVTFAARIFNRYDFLIFYLGVFGLITLLTIKNNLRLVLFSILYLSPLVYFYQFTVNPLNYRYNYHYLPIFSLFGGFFIWFILRKRKPWLLAMDEAISISSRGARTKRNREPRACAWESTLKKLINLKNKAIFLAFFILFLTTTISIQIWLSWFNISTWIDPANYEKQSAIKVKRLISQKNIKNPVIVTYRIEPYYLYSQNSVLRPLPSSPFFEKVPQNREFLIILDMPTKDQLKEFSKYVENNFPSSKIGQYYVGLPYRLDSNKDIFEIQTNVYLVDSTTLAKKLHLE